MAQPAFLDSLPGFLHQPTTLALLASLALHGIVGVSWPSDSDQPQMDSHRSVKLVELTPAEQSRLPQAALPTTPTVPTDPTGLVPTVPSTVPSTIPTSPGLPNLPLNPPTVTPWNWTYPYRSNIPADPAIVDSPKRPTKPQTPKSPVQNQTNVKKFPTNLADGNYTVAGTVKLPGAEQQEPTPTPEQTDPQPPATPKPSPIVRPTKISDAAIEQLMKLRQQKRAALGQPGAEGNPDSNTDQQAAANNKVIEWMTRNSEVQLAGSKELAVSEPASSFQGSVIVIAAIDAEGKASNIEIIDPAKDEAMNQAAVEVVKSQVFDQGTPNRGYLINVKFGNKT